MLNRGKICTGLKTYIEYHNPADESFSHDANSAGAEKVELLM